MRRLTPLLLVAFAWADEPVMLRATRGPAIEVVDARGETIATGVSVAWGLVASETPPAMTRLVDGDEKADLVFLSFAHGGGYAS